MKPRANPRQMKRAEIPRLWCSWGKHETIPLTHVKEQFPGGTMCLHCQLADRRERPDGRSDARDVRGHA